MKPAMESNRTVFTRRSITAERRRFKPAAIHADNGFANFC
jgi:hypothetical protein